MQRRGVFVFIAAGLLLAGAVVFWLGSGRESDAGSAALVSDAPTTAGAADTSGLPAARVEQAASAAPGLEELQRETPAVAQDPVPASYRRALGGLTGRIVERTPDDPDAVRPVAGLNVELAGGRKSAIMPPHDALLDPSQLEAHFILGAAQTGEDGRFRIEGIDPRTIGALLIDPGGPKALFWPLEVTPVSGETSDLGDLLLPSMATLTGTVVDERGTPIAGARVRATDLPLPEAFAGVADFRAGGAVLLAAEATDGAGDRMFVPPPSLARLESRLPFPTSTTDASGRFELTGVPPGLVVVVVDDGVHLPFARSGVATGAAGGRRDLGSLALADGAPLAVHVRTSDGKAVPAPQVFAGSTLPAAPIAVMKTPTQREPDGSARFTGLADGRAWVAARADERHDFTIVELPEVSIGEATITLQTPHALTLTTLDADHQPLQGVTLYGRPVKDSQMPDLLLPPIALADRTTSAEPGRYVVADLDPGNWEITAIATGLPQQRVNVDLTSGDSAAEVRFAAGHAVGVRVVSGADGSPVEWAFVAAYPDDDGLQIKLFDGPASSRRTDAQGLARFPSLPAGPVRFTVNHPGYAVTEVSTTLPAQEELHVALSEGGRIAGRVLDHGGPPPERLLVLLMSEDAPGDAELPRMALTDEEGAFRFERVEPGPAHLEARSRMEVGASVSLFETLANSPLAESEAVVTDGSKTDVLLEISAALADTETGLVSGLVTVNGAPASGWKVRTWGKVRRSVATGEDGRFDLGRIAAGEGTLLVSAPSQGIDGSTDQVEIDLKPDEQLWVPIDLTVGAITGHVRAASDGQPLAGVQVTAASDDEQSRWSRQPSTVTAHDGSFTIEPVVAGRYKVRARADGYAQASSESFEVAAFQTHGGVVLRLPAALAVAGTIKIEGSTEKPDWIWLVATGGDGGDGREGAQIDGDDMRFQFERLGPGEWTFELNTSLDTEFEPVKLELTGDRPDLELTFKPAPPDPPEAATTEQTFTYEVK